MQGENSLDNLNKSDSVSTRFMKALGYDGVDVRHLSYFDNTNYGSVIYDLKSRTEIKPLEPVNTQSNENTQPQAESATESQINNAETQQIINETPKQPWQLTKKRI